MDLLQTGQEIVILGVASYGLYSYTNFKKTTLELMPFYMLFVVGVQITSLIIQLFLNKTTSNALIYNIYDIVTYLFFLFWFYQVLPYKKIVVVVGITYFLILVFVLFTEDIMYSFSLLNSGAGAILILTLVITFFIYLINSDKVINFLSSPEFWIAIGLLTFNIGYLPLSLFLNNGIIENYTTVHIITTILIILLYGSFGISFALQNNRK